MYQYKKHHIEYVWSVSDISPLGKLKELNDITIFSKHMKIKSLKSLVTLPKLKSVYFDGLDFEDETESKKVLELLKKNGVKLEIK